jgi:hypothetical protein
MNGWPPVLTLIIAFALLIVLALLIQRAANRREKTLLGRERGQELNISLDVLITFLKNHQQSQWAKMLQSIQTDLQEPATATRALSNLGDMFGGMGSLNDLVLGSPDADDECGRLLDAVFRDMKLYHGTQGDYAEWKRLEVQHKDDPPPRIKHAFRK